MTETAPARKLRIRPATALDVDAAVRVRARIWRETYDGMFDTDFLAAQESEAGLAAQAEHWRELLSDGATIWLAVDAARDDEIVGFALAMPTREPDRPTLLELRWLYVEADVRGSGVAEGLLTYAIGDAAASLWVVADNARARAFYAKHGFAADGVEHVYHGARELRYVRQPAD